MCSESRAVNKPLFVAADIANVASPFSRLITAPTEGQKERQVCSEGEESVGLPLLVGVATNHDAQH
ncbi:MAG: hypothetical protein SLRJCFUN_000648 [Candidatus Fervidibacter sp.]